MGNPAIGCHSAGIRGCAANTGLQGCIHHLLSVISYEDLTPEPIVLPKRTEDGGYVRPPESEQTFVPSVYP